jgi:hypothetical protein
VASESVLDLFNKECDLESDAPNRGSVASITTGLWEVRSPLLGLCGVFSLSRRPGVDKPPVIDVGPVPSVSVVRRTLDLDPAEDAFPMLFVPLLSFSQ